MEVSKRLISKLLKNPHLQRFLHPSSLRRTPKYASGRRTNSSAWQDVAPYSSRRHSQDCLPDRQVKSAGGRPRKRDFEDSTCICLPAEASAQAGAFLSSLREMTLSKTDSLNFEFHNPQSALNIPHSVHWPGMSPATTNTVRISSPVLVSS
jgi:hypothetical protein